MAVTVMMPGPRQSACAAISVIRSSTLQRARSGRRRPRRA